jgi:CBS domain-containing protein
MFMSSAAFGGAFAIVVNKILPGANLSPGACALVAMAAVFGAASRATFAFIVFAFEITRDYNAILPLMLACVTADLIALRYLPFSIMTQKLARRGLRVPEEYEAGVLHSVRVSDVMRRDIRPIPPEMTVAELAERMGRGEPEFSLTQGLPIASDDGRLRGVVTQGDILRALKADPAGKMTVLEAGANTPVIAYEDESMMDALVRLLENDIGRMPVVSRAEPHGLVGFLNRATVLNAWSRHVEEEGVREHGWFAKVLDSFSNSANKSRKYSDDGENVSSSPTLPQERKGQRRE